MPADALWWSLALGACLGGNLTIVGASANVVVANVAERAGHPIHFGEFLRYGVIVVAGSMIISSRLRLAEVRHLSRRPEPLEVGSQEVADRSPVSAPRVSSGHGP